MSGLYLHIPFCKQACTYCDFHFSTNTSFKAEVVNAIIQEIKSRSTNWVSKELSSIYFGGGTPSLLAESELAEILNSIGDCFDVSPEAEITFEANPDDINEKSLKVWKANGVNRLSIGIQSFSDEILQWMKRAHSAEEAMRSLEIALEYGFESSNVDLIYGIPSLSQTRWEDDIERVLNSGLKHLSAYSLTLEPKTLFAHQVEKGISLPPDDEKAKRQFTYLREAIRQKGWEHYEISNYCQPGYRAKHNSQYWQRIPYLGVGPSAHSFDGTVRRWNVASNHLYLKKISSNNQYWETEKLTKSDKINELIMLGLRVKEGVNLHSLKENEGIDLLARNGEYIASLLEKGQIKIADGYLQLTDEGQLYADKIASDLFV